MTAFLEWNMGILTVLAEHRTAILDWFFAAFTWLGSEYVVIVTVCLLFLCIDKRLGYRMAFVFFLSSALVQGLKVLCRIDRPWVLAERDYPQYKDRYSPLELLGSKSGECPGASHGLFLPQRTHPEFSGALRYPCPAKQKNLGESRLVSDCVSGGFFQIVFRSAYAL